MPTFSVEGFRNSRGKSFIYINTCILRANLTNHISKQLSFSSFAKTPAGKSSSQMCCRLRRGFWCCYITVTIIVLASFFFTIFAAIFGPSSVRFHVTNTALTDFNLTNGNTLYYNFTLNITVRNPNKDVIVYYRRITAIAWYKDRDFAWVSLPPFDQGHKNTTLLQVAFVGHQVIDLKPRHVAEYNEETKAGIYNNLAVDLDCRIRTKYGRIRSSRYNPPVVQCKSMRVPLIGSGGESVAPFNDTKCRTGYFFQDRDAGDAAG